MYVYVMMICLLMDGRSANPEISFGSLLQMHTAGKHDQCNKNDKAANPSQTGIPFGAGIKVAAHPGRQRRVRRKSYFGGIDLFLFHK